MAYSFRGDREEGRALTCSRPAYTVLVMNINSIRISLSMIVVLCLSSILFAQKTVHVREYKRKDGTVVRAHDRRAPGSRSASTANYPSSSENEAEQPEPYNVIDLGEGSFFTPGGTGLVRLRLVGPTGREGDR